MEREIYYTPYGQVEISLDEQQTNFLDYLVQLYEQSGNTPEEAVDKAYETWKQYGQGGY